MNKPLRVGLDLDGVILYNPARIARPIVVGLKKLFAKKKVDTFFIPHKRFDRYLWYLFHKSSLFVSPGFPAFAKLVKGGKVQLYVISGRYSFLKEDLEKWIKKLGDKEVIEGYYFNQNDEQPYLFKEKMIEKLNLDVFIEDNWDIVKHMATKGYKTKVFWVCNILDFRIPYLYKFLSLGAVASFMKKSKMV